MKTTHLLLALLLGFLACSCGPSHRERQLEREILRMKKAAIEKEKSDEWWKKEEIRQAKTMAVLEDSNMRHKKMMERAAESSREKTRSAEKKKAEEAKRSKAKSDENAEEIRKKMAEIMGAPHSEIPKAKRSGGYSVGVDSVVTVKNDTSYILTIMYSGPTVLSRSIDSGGSVTVNLKPGPYQISATVNNPKVTPFAGEQKMSGGKYSSSFFIKTTRY